MAIIIPCGKDSEDDVAIRELVQRGIAEWVGGKPRCGLARIVSKGRKVSDAVVDGRS